MVSIPAAEQAAADTPVDGAVMPGEPAPGPAPNATMNSANRGIQAAALLTLQQASTIIGQALMVFGAGSDIGKDLLSVQTKLSKYLPATPPSSGLMSTGLRQLMMQQRQNGAGADLQSAMRLRPAAAPPPPASNGQPLQ